MEPKISVIVPVYNVEKYIRRCLDSITGQTYKNLEILLINDGSTDNSEIVCEEYAKKDSRVQYYKKDNGGLSDARNYGLKRITGDYVAFIDSDDCLSTGFFEVLINKSIEHNADIVSSDILFFYSDNELPKWSEEKELIRSSLNEKILYGRQIILQYLCPKDDYIIYHGLCMKLYRKELFEDLYFEIGKVHEDLYITYKLLHSAKCMVMVKVPLYYYFQNNGNSISNNYTVKNYMDECEGYLKIIDFFSDKSYDGELYNFGCRALLYSTIKAADFINDPEIIKTKKRVVRWVRENVFKAVDFSFYKKIGVYFLIDHIVLYRWLKKALKGT